MKILFCIFLFFASISCKMLQTKGKLISTAENESNRIPASYDQLLHRLPNIGIHPNKALNLKLDEAFKYLFSELAEPAKKFVSSKGVVWKGELKLNKKHLEVIKSRANKGDPRAQLIIGTLHYLGSKYVSNPSHKKAFKWFEKSALQGQMQAQFILARMYALGEGTDRNLLYAYAWLHKRIEFHPKKVGRILADMRKFLSAEDMLQIQQVSDEIAQRMQKPRASTVWRNACDSDSALSYLLLAPISLPVCIVPWIENLIEKLKFIPPLF